VTGQQRTQRYAPLSNAGRCGNPDAVPHRHQRRLQLPAPPTRPAPKPAHATPSPPPKDASINQPEWTISAPAVARHQRQPVDTLTPVDITNDITDITRNVATSSLALLRNAAGRWLSQMPDRQRVEGLNTAGRRVRPATHAPKVS